MNTGECNRLCNKLQKWINNSVAMKDSEGCQRHHKLINNDVTKYGMLPNNFMPSPYETTSFEKILRNYPSNHIDLKNSRISEKQNSKQNENMISNQQRKSNNDGKRSFSTRILNYDHIKSKINTNLPIRKLSQKIMQKKIKLNEDSSFQNNLNEKRIEFSRQIESNQDDQIKINSSIQINPNKLNEQFILAMENKISMENRCIFKIDLNKKIFNPNKIKSSKQHEVEEVQKSPQIKQKMEQRIVLQTHQDFQQYLERQSDHQQGIFGFDGYKIIDFEEEQNSSIHKQAAKNLNLPEIQNENKQNICPSDQSLHDQEDNQLQVVSNIIDIQQQALSNVTKIDQLIFKQSQTIITSSDQNDVQQIQQTQQGQQVQNLEDNLQNKKYNMIVFGSIEQAQNQESSQEQIQDQMDFNNLVVIENILQCAQNLQNLEILENNVQADQKQQNLFENKPQNKEEFVDNTNSFNQLKDPLYQLNEQKLSRNFNQQNKNVQNQVNIKALDSNGNVRKLKTIKANKKQSVTILTRSQLSHLYLYNKLSLRQIKKKYGQNLSHQQLVNKILQSKYNFKVSIQNKNTTQNKPSIINSSQLTKEQIKNVLMKYFEQLDKVCAI